MNTNAPMIAGHPSLLLAAAIMFLALPAAGRQTAGVDTSKVGPQVGVRVPDFSGTDQFGKRHTRASVAGANGGRLRAHATRYPASEIYHFKPLDERVPVFMKPFQLRREVTLLATQEAQKLLGAMPSITITGAPGARAGSIHDRGKGARSQAAR